MHFPLEIKLFNHTQEYELNQEVLKEKGLPPITYPKPYALNNIEQIHALYRVLNRGSMDAKGNHIGGVHVAAVPKFITANCSELDWEHYKKLYKDAEEHLINATQRCGITSVATLLLAHNARTLPEMSMHHYAGFIYSCKCQLQYCVK